MISLVVTKVHRRKATETNVELHQGKYNILESVPHEVSFKICLELKGH